MRDKGTGTDLCRRMLKKFLFERWQVAYRRKGEDYFTLLPNPKWGWAADPFPVVYEGSLYIFAEIFLYKSERNGVIAYCKWENDGFGDWQVSMDRHWHISYPNVFSVDGKLYMCPEIRQNEEIAVYELKAFPDKWEKVKVLLSNIQCVDSTFCEYQGERFLFTFRPVRAGSKGSLYLYRIEEEAGLSLLMESGSTVSARPGGNVISKGGRLIRVAQDGTSGYGCGLVFNEIDAIYPAYKEHEIKRISARDIPGNWNRKFEGVHTYNQIEECEVIDLKYRKFSLTEYLARKRIRKVFINKYK